ncbi:MAG: FAD-dependent oxidoreductase [Peptostreptococcaceae bacterium]|nr:FAD-dependent oxidoreductase [Peptostreptococcaceae bacterium]
MRDVIIIGKGPAGISAAIYLKRANLDVLVIGKGMGSLEKAEKIENYYGFPEPVSGIELLNRGITQAEKLGIQILSDEVVGIKQEENFIVQTTNSEFEARVVLLATGMTRSGLKVKGFDSLNGKGISFCAVCDGFFYRDKPLAVIGNGDYAASEIADLQHFTQNIKLFTNGLDTTTNKLAPEQLIVSDKILEIKGQDRVETIVTDKGEYLVDGIFVALGTASATDFAKSLGALTEGTNLIVNENFMTTINGIFAAGDCIGGFWQVSKAVSDGANASKHIISYLKASPL